MSLVPKPSSDKSKDTPVPSVAELVASFPDSSTEIVLSDYKISAAIPCSVKEVVATSHIIKPLIEFGEDLHHGLSYLASIQVVGVVVHSHREEHFAAADVERSAEAVYQKAGSLSEHFGALLLGLNQVAQDYAAQSVIKDNADTSFKDDARNVYRNISARPEKSYESLDEALKWFQKKDSSFRDLFQVVDNVIERDCRIRGTEYSSLTALLKNARQAFSEFSVAVKECENYYHAQST